MSESKSIEVDVTADREALAIYVVMAYDIIDALDMVIECTVIRTLEILLTMLELPGDVNTDRVLNGLLVEPVIRRLDVLRAAVPAVPA